MENQREFEEQVKATYRSLKLFLQFLGISRVEVPDLAHEVYIKALKAFKVSYDPTKSFKTWLFAIAKNTIIDWKRNKETKKNTVLIDVASTFVSRFDTEFQSQLEMKQTLSTLEPEDQLLIELRFFQDLPFKEIAELMDMSEGAVKMRSVRLLQKLLEKLE